MSVLVPPTTDLCLVPGGFRQVPPVLGFLCGAVGGAPLWLSGKRHMDARPLQEHGQDWCLKRSILGDQMLHLQFQCKPSSFAQISTYCLLTVSPEIPLSQQRSTLNQISVAFSRGHDPITLARRARCPAHVGSIFNECCLVRMSWKVLLVVFRRRTNTARRHNNRTGTSGN